MERKFFEMYSRQSNLGIEVCRSSVSDWIIIVVDKEGVPLGDAGKQVVFIQESDINLLFAKAYVSLAEYLLETRGGY